ncbi:hypothetical protein Esti_005099 [Eimeria stiedai]
MLRAAGSLLLFLAASLEALCCFHVIYFASSKAVFVSSVSSYMSPWRLSRPGDRLQASVAGRRALIETGLRSAKASVRIAGVHELRRSMKPFQNSLPYRTRSGVLKATSGESLPVSRAPIPPLAQHFLGVWHVYLPDALPAAFLSSADASLPKPLPLWITEDAEVACPDLKCEGLVRCAASGDCEVTLRMASPSPAAAEVELRGLLAHSSSPLIRLWDNRVELSAAVLAGAVFLRRLEQFLQMRRTVSPASVRRMPVSAQRDSSGRVVLSGLGEEASKEINFKGSDKRESRASTAPTYMGNFTAYRVLGEDQNELRFRHAFLNFGPRKIYNLVDPNQQEAVHAFFGGASPLVTCIKGSPLRCDSPRGRVFDVLKATLRELAGETPAHS